MNSVGSNGLGRYFWIGMTILWMVAVVPATFFAMMSFMMFDAPGSTESGLTVALFVSVLVSPVCCLAGAGAPWLFRRRRFAAWLFAIPLVDAAAAVTIVVLLQVFCGGNFICH